MAIKLLITTIILIIRITIGFPLTGSWYFLRPIIIIIIIIIIVIAIIIIVVVL